MTIDELRTEITAALAAVFPSIRGMQDLEKVSLSPEAITSIHEELGDHLRRKDSLVAVLTILDALELALKNLKEDGYPNLPKREVTAEVFTELQVQRDDIDAAIAEFIERSRAATMTISLGQATKKP